MGCYTWAVKAKEHFGSLPKRSSSKSFAFIMPVYCIHTSPTPQPFSTSSAADPQWPGTYQLRTHSLQQIFND